MTSSQAFTELQSRVVEQLCEHLRLHREERGWTQAQLAERAAMTRNHYQLLEAGRSATGDIANPRLSTLCALATALDVPLHSLIAVEEG